MTTRTMFRKVTLAALAAAVALPVLTAPTFAQAQDTAAPQGPLATMFQRFDSDGDGRVTQAEVQAFRAARAAALDADGDGFITADELVAQHVRDASEMAQARVARMMERRDTDGDGRLSAAELAAGPVMGGGRGGDGPDMARMFDRLDADNDGAVTLAETQAGMERMQQRRGDGHGMRGEHRGERGDRGDRPFWRMHDQG